MLRFAAALLLCAFLSAAAAQAAPAGEPVIPPGQEEVLAEILGQGKAFPAGCTLTGGRIDPTAVTGEFECPGGGVTLELRHPSRAPENSVRTERFAIVVRGGSPPAAFSDAFESWVRSHESAFEWKQLPPTPSPRPSLPSPQETSAPRSSWPDRLARFTPFLVPLAGALAALAVSWWVLRRLVRWQRARRGSRPLASRWKQALRDKWFWAGFAVLIVSFVLRCWIGILNQEQNDNHLQVADMIRSSGWAAPASSACFECSHPKLYHYVLAFALDLFPSQHMMVGNLLNVAAATALLILFFVFVRGGRWSSPVRFLGYAFLSFNAGLVGISSQATNDPFCILFSSLGIFCLDRFLAARSLKWVVAATVAVILAALSKASGWAIFASGAGVLVLSALASAARLRRNLLVATAVFVLGFSCVVPFVNPYRHNIARAGTPFVNDEFEVPVMKLEVSRPPVTWVFQSFFTFRFFELLRVPFNEYRFPLPDTLHRESLWSQLYGRMFFLRFDQNIWKNQSLGLLSLGRLCLVLGLLPLVALLLGAGNLLRSAWHGVSAQGLRWFALHHDWHHIVYIVVMLAAEIAILVQYRRLAIMFMWMKAFYLFPALLPFFKLFLDGLEPLWRRWPRFVAVWMTVLVLASVADMGWLISDLSGGSAG